MNLRVLEYSGTARSGKGTIVSHLADIHEGVATEETGADYRAVTFSLLNNGTIAPDMPGNVVIQAVENVGVTDLTTIVAARNDIVEAHTLEALYTPDVNALVATLSPVTAVRKAVKAGFRSRVESVRDNSEHNILLVDGRNLAPVVQSIPGTKLILRTFVSCSAVEAARRESVRRGSNIIDRGILRTILERNEADASRTVDPVRPESDALNYWDTGSSWSEIDTSHEFADSTRFGAGILAASNGKQIHFDTTDFWLGEQPKEAMLAAANQMFGEALTAERISQELALSSR